MTEISFDFQGLCQEHMCQPLVAKKRNRKEKGSDCLKCWRRLLKTHTCGLICFKLLYCKVCHIMQLKSTSCSSRMRILFFCGENNPYIWIFKIIFEVTHKVITIIKHWKSTKSRAILKN